MVIAKEPLGPDARGRLRHEVAMLERLRGVEGVVQLLDGPRLPGSIVVDDIGGTCLAGVAKPLAVDDLIGLAVGLLRAVAAVHKKGVLHRDITPANIVISRAGAPYLVDFALATSFAEIRPQFTHHSEIVGTLAYLAPEQTGRTGRSVDQRADLYAVGATLYELATGGPPFGSGDPLQLTHDHLARVPVPPHEVNRAVPGPLSEIIMHLLEKEPDNRYQTAEGVLYDLERLGDAEAAPARARVRIGEHDFPLRLLPPSRLVGRDNEVAALQAAFADALVGQCHGVVVSGAPGVGKTALVDELRSVATGRDGWFVAGKFDQYRRDAEFDGAFQAFRALGRLLLAEPEDELAEVRERILATVGVNAGLLTSVLPEFAALLGVPPNSGDTLTAQVRAQRAALEVLRAVASPTRPVVFFVDDLQWAGSPALGLIDLVLTDEPVAGLLLVGAYREDEIDAAHPLAAPLSRWCDQSRVLQLRLDNLGVPSLVTLVAEVLHVDAAHAAGLVEVIEPQTGGNPYETMELLNLLRRDGVLTATADGWRWDNAVARGHLGQSEVAGLLAARVDALPPQTRHVVEAMACLAGRAEVSVLEAATGEPAGAVEERLVPAMEDGLLVGEPGLHQTVRFRHDRIRDAILDGMEPEARRTLKRVMARRLAAVPELFAVAAEQYLPVVDAVVDAAERRRVVGLLRRAAGQAGLIGDHALVNALLLAALRLIDGAETATLVEVHTGRHAALYSIGRLHEADEEYRTLARLCDTAVQLADATVVQVHSLTYRNRCDEAIELGLRSLRECAVTVPPADRMQAELDDQFDHLYRWLDETEAGDDLARPEITDPSLLAATRLINAILPAAYLAPDPLLHTWLSLEALQIWREHGPGPTLLGPAGHAATAVLAQRGDTAAAYRAIRRVLAVGEARDYEPSTSQARFLYSVLSCWFEPIENGARAAQQARDGLIAGGDLAHAGYAYLPGVQFLLDCAPSLDGYASEVEAGLAFARRTGSDQVREALDGFRWLASELRGEGSAAPGPALPRDSYADNPTARLYARFNHALAAAIFGDMDGLAGHIAAVVPLLPGAVGQYLMAVAYLLRGLALAAQARTADGDERGALLAELDEVTGWLAGHAADSPANFLHLLRFLEAERAWTVGDLRAAGLAFDAARREVAKGRRPWHRALITERAARFHIGRGIGHTGHSLLVEARQDYLAWGATAKVEQLDRAYPFLQPRAGAIALDSGDQPDDPPRRRARLTMGTIDLLGIVSASQVLSSETTIAGLHARVVEILSAMTGATGVHLVLYSEDRRDWVVPATSHGTVPSSGPEHERTLPLTVLRYAQRMGEPLVVSDATRDDRFARDPYFLGLPCCALLAVPILSRGSPRAVLLLENRLIRGAFTSERLDAVTLIGGQLAVSLDNAQLYTDFRRIADEQAALRRVATLVARGASPEEVFAAVTEEVGQVLRADHAGLGRYEPDGAIVAVAVWSRTGEPFPALGTRWPLEGKNLSTIVYETRRPARVDSYADASGSLGAALRERGYRSSVGTPVVVDGRLWGMISAGWNLEPSMSADTEARLADFTELLATAIANAESRAELTTSRARIVAAADHTRRRIERDLHDGAQQRLVHTVITLKLARRALADVEGPGPDLVHEALENAQRATEELRELAHGIHPSILTSLGLGRAIEALADRSIIPVTLEFRCDVHLPERIDVTAYFIVSEALTNAAKHAGASSVHVAVATADGNIRLMISDDGVGGADPARGTGLVGLKDRVEALGGSLTIQSRPGQGTRLSAVIPIEGGHGAGH